MTQADAEDTAAKPQLSMRVLEAEIALWKSAAELDHRTLTSWVRSVCNKAAKRAIRSTLRSTNEGGAMKTLSVVTALVLLASSASAAPPVDSPTALVVGSVESVDVLPTPAISCVAVIATPTGSVPVIVYRQRACEALEAAMTPAGNCAIVARVTTLARRAGAVSVQLDLIRLEFVLGCQGPK